MKVFLEWLDDWNLGIEEIDRDHMNLVELLNMIADSLNGENPVSNHHEETMPLVMRLIDETRQHFSNEESVMREHGYPKLIEHHREHIMLLAELRDFIREIEEGKRLFDTATLTSLKRWLINHVIDYDMDIARFINNG